MPDNQGDKEPETNAAASGDAADAAGLKVLLESHRELFEQSAVGMGTLSADGRFLTTNQRFREIIGYTGTELLALRCRDITHPDDRAFEVAEEGRLLRGEVHSSTWEKRYIRKDGRIVWASLTLSRLNSGGQPILSGVMQDITERKLVELDLARTRRALQMLSRCNEALVRMESEQALLEQICSIAVDVGAYRMAGVLFAQEDERKTFLPVAHAGVEEGYFAAVTLSWAAERPEGRGPAGLAIRAGLPVMVPDLAADPDFAPWLAAAAARGYRSVISLPLTRDGRTFGIFVLYGAEVRSISDEEVGLLRELAADLAFGIMNLRAKAELSHLLAAVAAVTASVSSSIGAEFYEKLLLSLGKTLGASAAFISGTLTQGHPTVRAICAVVDGKVVPGFQYAFQGTPCEDVHQDQTLVIRRDVCLRYPSATAMAALESEAYAGTNLFDSAGRQIGTLFVLFRQPLTHEKLVTSVLQLFAARAAAEMVRQKSDSQLHEQAVLLDKAQDAIFVRNMEHQIVYWNQGAERLYGWSAQEIIGRSVFDLKIENQQAFIGACEALVRDGEWTGELSERTKDGRSLIVECHWTLVHGDGRGHGSPQSILAINTDITERKRSEAQLRLLETSVARLNDMVVITEAEPIDEPGPRIVFVNDAFERRTGYRRDEVIGGSPRRLQGPETARVELDRIRAAMEKWQPVRAELINYTRGGEPFWIEMDLVPLADSTGHYTHWVAVERDITDRKRSELKLQESDARLAHSQKMESIGQLTGGIAHDFNNLLTVILGNSELLEEELQGNPRLQSLAGMVRTAGERGAEMTSRLLAFARRQALEPTLVYPGRVAAGMLPLLQRTLGGNIDVRAVDQDGSWPAFIDPGQFESALLNLCINARDAMPAGGRLLIESSNVQLDKAYADSQVDVVPGDYVVVAVTDTGTGIPAEALGRVFEPFYTTKSEGKGTGLGLSMVYGFTRQSGGHVKLYSEVDAGTVVKVYLPRAVAAPDLSGTEPEETAELHGHETVLVVEDNELVRQHATRQLRELGYRILVAAGGGEALDLVRGGEAFDLLFTDVMMPGGMNGAELAAEIEKLRPGIPVLFASGYTENAIVHQGRVDAGVNLLHKPYTRRRLAEKLRQVLRGR